MGKEDAAREAAAELSSAAAFGAPCWVSLTTRDLRAAQEFYGAVLGWGFRAARFGDRFSVALSDGQPVAGIGAVASEFQIAVAWTPYFAVTDADEAAGRVRERSGTVAVGPIALALGRAALVADLDGATFGIWQGVLPSSWPAWRDQQPAQLRLHSLDVFEAAIFYGGVLEWAADRPGACEVVYEHDEVVLRSAGLQAATIAPGGRRGAPDPFERPHWDVRFNVDDMDAALRAVRDNGGSVVARTPFSPDSGEGPAATVRDPDGGLFTIVPARPRS